MPFARADGHAQGLINACRKGERVILPRRKALLPEPHRDRQIFSQLAQPRRGRIRDRVQPARQRRSRILRTVQKRLCRRRHRIAHLQLDRLIVCRVRICHHMQTDELGREALLLGLHKRHRRSHKYKSTQNYN